MPRPCCKHVLRAIAVLHFPIYEDSPTHAASNSRSPFPHLCTEKLSAPAALAAGAGHYFSLTAYNLTFKPPYRGKGLKKDIS